MMDFLRRGLAPVASGAWGEIDETVARVLRAQLRGRSVVDVEGPFGLDRAAVGLGRLNSVSNPEKGEVGFGVHRVQPLVETRVSFDLDVWELDNHARGAVDLKLDAAEEAARAIARFEDEAVFNGFDDGSIVGLTELREHDPVAIAAEPGSFLDGVARALLTLRDAGVEGPYALVLGPDLYRLYATHAAGYPLKKQVQNLVEGDVVYARSLEGALLLSQRGGDFVLTLGQDLAVGYEGHTNRTATLFITESFTFRVVDPNAGVVLPVKSSQDAVPG
ncbi:MAG: family 1 encapsulin nanocompartment shell protein [Candidatus Krumholzibacteriia bacterium]